VPATDGYQAAHYKNLKRFSKMRVQSSTAPTASQDPAIIDQTWQKASSKYDAQREALLKKVDNVDGQGLFRPDWESLQKYEVPEWYKDAKFGIFIHWGVYSVPAFGNEWYPRNMYREGSEEYKHHLATYGPPNKFGYKDFIPMSKAEHYDPAAWAELFKKAGARYVVPVAEHHDDGFAMYDSGVTDWTAARMGPHRDLIGELSKAVRAAGLHFGVSSHHVEHNFFLGVARCIASDVNDPQYAAFYGPAYTWLANTRGTPLNNDFTYVSSGWANDWLARATELVEKYHPDIVYFDWWIGQASIRPNLTRFAEFYDNESQKYGGHIGVTNYKDYAMQEHSGVLDLERGQLGDTRPLYWQTDCPYQEFDCIEERKRQVSRPFRGWMGGHVEVDNATPRPAAGGDCPGRCAKFARAAFGSAPCICRRWFRRSECRV